VVLAAVVDEEDLSLGTQHFLKNWPAECPFDFAVVTEPTNLRVCSAHKGFAWLEVSTEGIAAHGSRPDEGVDAIRAMARVLQELELLDQRLQCVPAHALLGTGSLHASLIQGGREWSSYPNHCVLKYERRTIPGESDAVVEGEQNAILDKLRQSDPRFRGRGRFVFSRAPLEVDRDQASVRRFRHSAILLAWTGRMGSSIILDRCSAVVLTLAFQLRFLAHAAKVFIRSKEYVIADDVVACAEVIYRFVMGS
jgi:acetylornithine deacetylase